MFLVPLITFSLIVFDFFDTYLIFIHFSLPWLHYFQKAHNFISKIYFCFFLQSCWLTNSTRFIFLSIFVCIILMLKIFKLLHIISISISISLSIYLYIYIYIYIYIICTLKYICSVMQYIYNVI